MPDTFTITLAPVGQLVMRQPLSWSARVALDAALGMHVGDQRVAFVSVAAIGICLHSCPGDPKFSLPKYNPASGDIIGYGAQVMDVLVGKYRIPPGVRLWTAGRQVLEFVSGSLPREADVEQTADFSTPPMEDAS